MRPTVGPDEHVVDVLAHVQQQEMGGSLRVEPLAQGRLGAQDVEDRPVAVGTPRFALGHDQGELRIVAGASREFGGRLWG